MRNMDGVLAASEPVRGVVNDGGRRDLDLGWKQTVAGAQPARAEDMPRRERASSSPDDKEQGNRDCRDNDRRDDRR